MFGLAERERDCAMQKFCEDILEILGNPENMSHAWASLQRSCIGYSVSFAFAEVLDHCFLAWRN
jgi:hypothetical protein